MRRAAPGIANAPFVTSLRTRAMLARYLIVGATVGALDLGTMKVLLAAHVSVAAATTIAYVTMGVIVHFTVNKLFTFRNLDRATLHLQIRSYLAVTAICYVSTMVVVLSFAHFGASPLLGKAVGIVLNVPLAFVCNRRFTFGARDESARAEVSETRARI